jgi:hypothetical protein
LVTVRFDDSGAPVSARATPAFLPGLSACLERVAKGIARVQVDTGEPTVDIQLSFTP